MKPYRSRFLIAISALLVHATICDGQENQDALTFREIFFSPLLDSHIDSPGNLAISGDGRDIYFGSSQTKGIYQFRRNAKDGTLLPGKFTSVVDDNLSPIQVVRVVATRDGRFLYAAVYRPYGDETGGIAKFSRDSRTGEITQSELLVSRTSQALSGIHLPLALTISPDDRSLYVVSGGGYGAPEGWGVLSLDPDNGDMSIIQVLSPIGDTDYVSKELVVSPDGRSAYRSTRGGLVLYNRATDGRLSLRGTLPIAGAENSLMDSIAISPDSTSVYASEHYSGFLVTLARDDEGNLREQSRVDDPPGGPYVFGGFGQVVTSDDGRRVYAISFASSAGIGGNTQILAFSRDTGTGDLTLQELLMDGLAGYRVLMFPETPIVSPDSKNLYISASDAVLGFQVARPDLPCRDASEIETEYAALTTDFALEDDIDGDGLPESASLALLRGVACGAVSEGLDEATTNAYLYNLASINADPAVYQTAVLDGYQHAIASLLLTSAAMRSYLNEALGAFGTGVDPFYVAVNCMGDSCEPANARVATANGFGEPFSGQGDADLDTVSNVEEWNNVLSWGGNTNAFVRAAMNPNDDGTQPPAGSDDGMCFIATAAFGTPLADELGALRQFRDKSLLPNPLGAAFSDAYYRLSPSIASAVSQRPGVAACVRKAISPLVHFVQWLDPDGTQSRIDTLAVR